MQGAWVIRPDCQYTHVATNPSSGIFQGASTRGGAVLATYNFKRGFSLPVRPEYIKSSGDLASGSVNLLYGPGSGAFGFTVTPTYRKDAFFMRGDLAIVHATDSTPGAVFGPAGANTPQPR